MDINAIWELEEQLKNYNQLKLAALQVKQAKELYLLSLTEENKSVYETLLKVHVELTATNKNPGAAISTAPKPMTTAKKWIICLYCR